MTEKTEVPEPEDSGSDGSQKQADLARELIPAKPLTPPIAEAITGLATSHARAFGGEVAATLIAGATSQMAIELTQTKHELAQLREKHESLSNAFSDEKVRTAVLAERIEGFRSTRHLKNIGIAVGTLLVGTGVQLSRGDNPSFGIASIIVGVVLLIVGWTSAPKEGKNDRR